MENEYIYSEEFQAYGDKLKNNLSQYVTLETTLLDGNTVAGEGESAPLKCMQEFLDASLVGDKDTAMKKLFAAGLALANDSGVLPDKYSSPEGIASIVDDSLTRAKTAYKVATGEIALEEVADTLIDMEAAHVMTVTDLVLDHPETSVELLCDAVSAVYPPVAESVQMIKPIIKRVAKQVAPQAKEFIHAGINRISQFAKEAARPIIAKAREIGAKVKNRILNAILG